MTNLQRRGVLKQGAGVAALAAIGLLNASEALALDDELAAFGAESLADALRALGGIPAVGAEITLTLPDVAENGAVVPVTVSSSLPDTREIFIVVEANPNPLIARFTIPEGTAAFVYTRIKVAESGPVYALVRAGEQLYATSKPTKVLIGGCG